MGQKRRCEKDGLALSSRNVYLTPEQRQTAPVLYRALRLAREQFVGGERDADALRAIVGQTIGAAGASEIEYVSLAGDDTLIEIHGQVTAPALLSLVARFGHTRLLDNIELA